MSTNKNAPTTKIGNEGAATSEQNTIALPSNPNEQRALDALRGAGPNGMSRKALDAACGTSNSPEIIRRLRAKGHNITTTLTNTHNRFGDAVTMGIYHLIGGPADD